MPVMATVKGGEYAFIYPTPQWQTTLIKDMSVEEFDVDEEKFYIRVKVE
jgi:hypothetical protein